MSRPEDAGIVVPTTTFEDPFSEEVWKSTYKDHTDNSIDDTLRRVARYVAGAEDTDYLKEQWENRFYDMLSGFKCTAGGRIYANAGTEWNGTTMMNCFNPEVEVLTSAGPKQICDVEIGDLVLTHKGRFRPVTHTMTRHYVGPVQRFSSSYLGGDIISTPEHPYYQGNGAWNISDDTRQVVLPYRTNENATNPIILDLKDLMEGYIQQGFVEVHETTVNTIRSYTGGQGAHIVKKGQPVNRFIAVDDTFAYLLGRFIGDGCTFRNNNHPAFQVDAFNVAYNTETETKNAFEMIGMFEEVFGISPNLITSQNNTTYVRKASLIVAEVLRQLVGSGFDTKRVPTIIWESDARRQRCFLRGLYDADGFITSRGFVQIELTNPTLLKEIQTMMVVLGVPSARDGNRLFAGATYTNMFRSQLSKSYGDDRLTLECKKAPTTGPRLIPNEGFVVRPERFDEEYAGWVYNISVEEDESYVVNNVVVHNCFVSPRADHDIDSLPAIIADVLNQAQTLKSEGGWGQNFGFLRPRGAFINGIGVETPGAVKYMEIYDKVSDVITSGSGRKSANKKAKGKIRKGAMMGIIDVWHPDVIEFITAKQQAGRLTKFNMSVNCTDEFMQKVLGVQELKEEIAYYEAERARAHQFIKDHPEEQIENEDGTISITQNWDAGGAIVIAEAVIRCSEAKIEELDKWPLRFPDTTHHAYNDQWDGDMKGWEAKGYPIVIYREVSATWLWNLIMESTYNRAEPGVLFLDRANHFDPLSSYLHKIVATNPCGEQTLPPGGVCNLGSVNLTQFICDDRSGFDMEAIEATVGFLTRFLDNINSLSHAPLPEYLDSMRDKRRVGIGILGWGSALFMLKTRFGSERAAELREQVMSTIARSAYKASIDLAAEKGMFKYCDPIKHADAPFVKNLGLSDEWMEKLRTHGIRNSSLLSIQPTGNTSIFANVVSGGLEPIFSPGYIRTVIVGDMPDHIADVTPKWFEGEWHETEMFKFTFEGDEEILKGVGPDDVTYKIDKNRGLTKEVACLDYAVRWLADRGEWDVNADWAVTTSSLTVDDHVNDLKGFARWVDSAMSKTVNVPNEYPLEDFMNIYLESYKSGYVKGVTTYRAGTMTTVLAAKDEQTADDSDEEIVQDDVKLPNQMPATLTTIRVEGKKWYVTTVMNEVGTRPVAFFVYTNVREHNPATFDTMDRLLDLAREKNIPEKWVERLESQIGTDNNPTKIARCISLCLRHGILIKNVVAALDKVEEAYVGTFVFQIKKYLSSFIKDGETVEDEKCMECGGEVVYSEGCKRCVSCAASLCG